MPRTLKEAMMSTLLVGLSCLIVGVAAGVILKDKIVAAWDRLLSKEI